MPSVVSYLLRKFWVLCAILLIALALVVQSGRSLFPLLERYQDQVASYLSSQLELELGWDQLQTEWQGLKPSVSLRGLVVDDLEDNRLLAAEQAYLRLDLLSSALQWRWAWEKLELRGAHVSLSQSEQGGWGLPGLPATELANEYAEPIAPDDLLELFQMGTRVELLETQVHLTFANEHQVRFVTPYLLLENRDDFHRLSVQVDLEHRDRAAFAVVEGWGNPKHPDSFRTEGYLQLRQFPTREPLAALGGALLGDAGEQQWYRDGRLNARLWFSSQPGGKQFDLRGEFALDELALTMEELTLDRVSASVSGQWQDSGQWQLTLQELTGEWRDRELEPVNLAASSAGPDAPVQLMADRFNLEYWSLLADQLALLGGGRLQEVVQTMAPEGELRNLQLSLPQQKMGNWQLLAELHQVSVEPWGDVPGLAGVNGFLEADQRGGHLDLDSREGFSMHYAKLYEHPMDYQQARGRVAWHLKPERNKIYVNSGTLELSGEGEQARGSLWLMLPWEPGTGDIDLYLDIYGEQISAQAYAKYLPQLVPEGLTQWLADSIGDDNPGQAEHAHFVFRGTLNDPDPMARSYQLALDLVGAELAFDPEWPPLSELHGSLYLDDNRVDADIQGGRFYNSQLTQTRIGLEENSQGAGALLSIQGQIDGLASDGLELLRDSYLRRFIGDNMDSWTIRGELDAEVDLAIPLEEGEPGARQKVVMDLKAPQLTIGNFDLDLRDVQGRISYSDEEGLVAQSLDARLFDEPLSLSILTDRSQAEAPVTRIDFSGEVSSERLAEWSERPEFHFFDGKLAYDSRLELTHHLEADQEQDQRLAALAVTTDLKGVALDLPEPYGKLAQEQRPLQFNLILGRKTALVDVRYDDQLQALAQLDQDTGQVQRANLALGAPASLPGQPGLHLSGRLEKLDLDHWQELFGRYQGYLQALNPNDDPASEPAGPLALAGQLPISADIELGHHQLGPARLEDLSLDLQSQEAGWRLAFHSEALAGELNWAEAQPLNLRFDHVHLSSELLGLDRAEGDNDGKAGFGLGAGALDLAALPDARVELRQLTWEGEDLGRWQFQLTTEPEILRLESIQGEVRGLNIGGVGELDGASIHWRHAGSESEPEQTRLQARLQTGDLSRVMASFGQTDVVESESTDYQLRLSWSGAPQDFAVETLQGDIDFALRAGRFKRNPASGSDGILRLFAVLNFDSLARRMRLDFSDLYQSGLAYDSIQGRMSFKDGLMVFSEPVQVRSPSSRLQLGGQADLVEETLDARLVATLPVAGNLTFLTALAAGLPAAAGVYLVSKLFQRQVDQATSISYTIRGDWDDPQIRFDRMFEGGARLRADAAEASIERPEGSQNN